MRNKGFTLIELMIVIALLGALAVGLLAAVDPFEQLKKGTDTSTRNTVSEFYNAAIRYYSTNNVFPWGTAGFSQASSLSDLGAEITALISAGELKEKFMQLASDSRLSKITAYGSSGQDLAVCFKPDSKSFRLDPNTIYTVSGSELVGCPSAGDCFWCVQ